MDSKTPSQGFLVFRQYGGGKKEGLLSFRRHTWKLEDPGNEVATAEVI